MAKRPFDVICKAGETMEQVPERQADGRSQQLQDETPVMKSCGLKRMKAISNLQVPMQATKDRQQQPLDASSCPPLPIWKRTLLNDNSPCTVKTSSSAVEDPYALPVTNSPASTLYKEQLFKKRKLKEKSSSKLLGPESLGIRQSSAEIRPREKQEPHLPIQPQSQTTVIQGPPQIEAKTPPSSVLPSTSPVKLPLWTSPRRRSASESADNRLQAASTSTPVSVLTKPIPLWTSPRRRSASDLHDSDQKTVTTTGISGLTASLRTSPRRNSASELRNDANSSNAPSSPKKSANRDRPTPTRTPANFLTPQRRLNASIKSVADLRLTKTLAELGSTTPVTPLNRLRPSHRQFSSVDVRSAARRPVVIASQPSTICETPPNTRGASLHVQPKSALKCTSTPRIPAASTSSSAPSTCNHGVKFDKLNVLYFDRIQGNTTVPIQGEITIAMDVRHFTEKSFSLEEDRKRVDLRLEEELTEEDLRNDTARTIVRLDSKQRAKLLKRSGVKIERPAENELEQLRESRMKCGCKCADGFCFPETCECFQNGVQCQVDGVNEMTGEQYPCFCTPEGCDNSHGRLEYDPVSVHLHNITKIKMWKDMHKSETFDSPSYRKFDSSSDEEEVLPGRQPCSSSTAITCSVPISPRLPLSAIKSRLHASHADAYQDVFDGQLTFSSDCVSDRSDSTTPQPHDHEQAHADAEMATISQQIKSAEEAAYVEQQAFPLQKKVSRLFSFTLPMPEPISPDHDRTPTPNGTKREETAAAGEEEQRSPRKFPKVGSLL
ncbi:hypothetical protein WR25_12688 [Diploscapter pachys]|uniref:Cysteine/serine-rich nuclear protein N-terminal domain-containing protein n=1 Tax=Diploscapter pachys TaxID=2018661 RepID=A0A2A2J487_9BILA|nr:hypothetical protein WR25_12688 [Diploscapter pachys]